MSATATRPKLLVIRLPSGRVTSLPEYARSWRILKATDPRRLVAGWGHFPTDAGTILRELREGMHDRINAHLPGYGVGRKWGGIWQRDMARAARELNHPRLVISWLPADLRERFGHRLRCSMEG